MPLIIAVRDDLQAHAAKARSHGSATDFSSAACAALLRVPETAVLSVVRALVDDGWLTRDWRIVDWTMRQPDKEDPTAAQRQRNKRLRDAAVDRAKLGIATEEDLELLSKPEREALAKLAGMSRVTAQEIAHPKPERVTLFRAVVAKEDTFAAKEIAQRESHSAARRWLLGDGTTLHGYGPASLIVAPNYRSTRHSADTQIRGWLEAALQEDVLLAEIISGAYEQGLTGENFQGVVQQRITALVEERTTGPKLPFRPFIQRGGAA